MISDVVMPHKSSYALADELSEVWVGLRILFLSGYAEGMTPMPPIAAEEYRGQPQLLA